MMTAASSNSPRPWAVTANQHPSADWDAFVSARPQASVYLLSGWALLLQELFGHSAYFLEARDAQGTLLGILPVVQQKSLLSNFMTSLPFFNYGGALCDSEPVALDLMEHAKTLAARGGCSYLELRDIQLRNPQWSVRTDKVSMILQLPDTVAQLSQQLGSKLRSQVRRAERESASVRVGGKELLADFYAVFAENMRELGTPVHPRGFFGAILDRFPQFCRLIVIYSGDVAAAAGFVVLYRENAEIPWAACRSKAKSLGFNMRLYWEVLSFVVEQKASAFDFGRSTRDAGTYNFKKQWGAKPIDLHWHRWERSPKPQLAEQPHAERPMRKYAAAAWKKLPLVVANSLGPLVSPNLPW